MTTSVRVTLDTYLQQLKLKATTGPLSENRCILSTVCAKSTNALKLIHSIQPQYCSFNTSTSLLESPHYLMNNFLSITLILKDACFLTNVHFARSVQLCRRKLAPLAGTPQNVQNQRTQYECQFLVQSPPL